MAQFIDTGNSESVWAPRPFHAASFPRKEGADSRGWVRTRSGRAREEGASASDPAVAQAVSASCPERSSASLEGAGCGGRLGSESSGLLSCQVEKSWSLSPEQSVLTGEMDPECWLVTWNGGGAQRVRRGWSHDGLVAERVLGPLRADTRVPDSGGRWGQRRPSQPRKRRPQGLSDLPGPHGSLLLDAVSLPACRPSVTGSGCPLSEFQGPAPA